MDNEKLIDYICDNFRQYFNFSWKFI